MGKNISNWKKFKLQNQSEKLIVVRKIGVKFKSENEKKIIFDEEVSDIHYLQLSLFFRSHHVQSYHTRQNFFIKWRNTNLMSEKSDYLKHIISS